MTAYPGTNPGDAMPIVRRPMGLPNTAGCDAAWIRIGYCSDASCTDMQCLGPPGSSPGGNPVPNSMQSTFSWCKTRVHGRPGKMNRIPVHILFLVGVRNTDGKDWPMVDLTFES